MKTASMTLIHNAIKGDYGTDAKETGEQALIELTAIKRFSMELLDYLNELEKDGTSLCPKCGGNLHAGEHKEGCSLAKVLELRRSHGNLQIGGISK